jgi:HSP20 family molecular chaperone IbpA
MAERAGITQQTGKSTAIQVNPASTTLRFVEPQAVHNRLNELYDAIARRAFEMFEGDGSAAGRDLDHWFKAEAELLHPVHVTMREADEAITVRAEVPGFSANDLQVSLESRRLTISGKKQSNVEEKKGNVVYSERCSSEILRSIELPVEVDASRATSTLSNGILELSIPKQAAKKVPVQAAAQAKSAGAA